MKLKNKIENHIVDDMSKKQIKYLKAVPPDQAQGKLADIYQQVRRDFQLVPPITLFSPVTELLAGLWSITRESQIAAGLVSRQDKEAISAAVSSINTCDYCIDAHVGMLHGTSAHSLANLMLTNNMEGIVDPKTKALVNWALMTRTPQNELLHTLPFRAEEIPEVIGTALSYHFINPMVAIFLGKSPLPVNTNIPILRKIATRVFGATAGKSIATKQASGGDSLVFLVDSVLPQEFSWAESNTNIAKAYAGFSTAMETAGEETIPEEVRNHLIKYLEKWQGDKMPLSRQWLEDVIKGLAKKHQDCARLVFLTALSPYQIDEKIITNFSKQYPTNEELLSVTCWASYTVTKRISQWLNPSSHNT